jgi:hypothetical protein
LELDARPSIIKAKNPTLDRLDPQDKNHDRRAQKWQYGAFTTATGKPLDYRAIRLAEQYPVDSGANTDCTFPPPPVVTRNVAL